MRRLINTSSIFATIMISIALFVSGCTRKSSDAANAQFITQTSQDVENSNPAAAPAPQAQAASEAASVVQADGQPDMAALNRVARLWMIRNRRRPTSWDDFAANAGVQIPLPPSGKKYALSRDMRVTLVDR
jgi:hypothetical protein